VCDVIRKVVACLIRSGRLGQELLVFTHPDGSVQIPKGTLEGGESAEAAVLRELHEESGISEAAIGGRVVDLDRPAPQPTTGGAPLEDQIWHIFRLHSSKPTPDSWQHRASGSPEEDELVFSCRWIRLSRAKQHLHELYHPVVDALLAQDSVAG
jgi:8-oxo-dGTP pyrophosphatase MutT (NUDIX family)